MEASRKEEILEELNKELCSDGKVVIYDFLTDGEGNPTFAFAWTKDIHISSIINKDNLGAE